MSKIAVTKGQTKSAVTAGKVITLSCPRPIFVLLGKVTDNVSPDHRSAALNPNSVYQFQSDASQTSLATLSGDVDPTAQLLDVVES